MNVFCLKPIKPDHESWPASRVDSKIEWVKVWDSSEDDARYKVARATDVPDSELPKSPLKINMLKYGMAVPMGTRLRYILQCGHVEAAAGEPYSSVGLQDVVAPIAGVFARFPSQIANIPPCRECPAAC